ncbi:hypothetical protein SAMN06295912_15010 [Sphingomonas laterariae]|uniref:Uncharacterized protein n=1 Tax=Edaphosphingomonas laterariae TaxID=861865 RepID=A0A239KCG5_9SPHN|nr:hypothetical protein [Sphingomonas laterariae]SNT15785.1 hypothetical protein SAMN06295912_15010 [Sphingomonas laterariae]
MRLSKYPDKQITQAQALAQLKSLLTSARSIDQFTVDSLGRMFRVPPKQIEYELTIARQKRAAQ